MQSLRKTPPHNGEAGGHRAQVIDVVRSYFEQQVNEGRSPLAAGELVAIDFSRALSEMIASHLPEESEKQLRLVEAIMRGATAREEMLRSHGGAVSALRVADILDVSKTRVHARYNAGSLVGVRRAKQNSVVFPVWQFDMEVRRVRPVVEDALRTLRAAPLDDWGRMDFFLSPRDELKGKAVVDLLQTHPARVLGLARQYAS